MIAKKSCSENYTELAVILAAGRGTRMMPLTANTPKCLLKYHNECFIKRLVRQLANSGVKEIVVVVGYLKEQVIEELKDCTQININFIENDRYQDDTNIYSLYLATENITKPYLILEADVVLGDDAVDYVAGNEFGERSVWFTSGDFLPGQYGGILRSDENKNIKDIQIVPEYSNQYQGYKKLSGLMKVGNHEIKKFKEFLCSYQEKSIQQYYLYAWIDNLKILPAIESDIHDLQFATFNTPEDYNRIVVTDEIDRPSGLKDIKLIEISRLKHIEDFDPQRVDRLVKKIEREGVWRKPIYVEKKNLLVLDGQHRLEAAKKMGMRCIPAQLFNYKDVEVWSLREEEEVSRSLVIERSLTGRYYPYKTAKHRFPNPINYINVPLENLKSSSVKVIILAAGQVMEIEGLNQVLLKDPKTGKTIMDEYLKMFDGHEINVVVGYNAVDIMSQYPQLNYIYNPDWRITGNSYSLSLALSDEPCIILSADFFMDKSVIQKLKNTKGNVAAVRNSRNRSPQSLNCTLSPKNRILSVYPGPMSSHEPEAIGLYKLEDKKILRQLKNNCQQQPSLAVFQNLPLNKYEIFAFNIDGFYFSEINNPLDYLNFIKSR